MLPAIIPILHTSDIILLFAFHLIRAALLKEASPPGPVGAVPNSTKTDGEFDLAHAKTTPTVAKSKGKRKREGLLGVVKKKKPETEESIKISTDHAQKDADIK